MAIVEFVPRKTKPDIESKVHISFTRRFSKKKKIVHVLVLRIGKKVAKAINLMPGDRVSFFCNDEYPRIWFIKKSQNKGYKLGGKPHMHTFTIQCTWDLFIPDKNEFANHLVGHKIDQDSIIIDAKNTITD
jgi:hypothetical protein